MFLNVLLPLWWFQYFFVVAVVVVNFEPITHLVPEFSLSTLSM